MNTHIALYSLLLISATLVPSHASSAADPATALKSLPICISPPTEMPTQDFLLDPGFARAKAYRNAAGNELILDNGLIRRTWRIDPNGACVGFDNLMTGQAMLRSVRPEARVDLDGVECEVGGLTGQPNHAYLAPEWLDAMQANPQALQLVGVELGQPKQRFRWAQSRHHSPDVKWPPSGTYVRFDYEMPLVSPREKQLMVDSAGVPSDLGRNKLLEDNFARLTDEWTVHASPAHPHSSFQNEGKVGEIYAPANAAVVAERALPAGTKLVEVKLDAGTDRSFSWGPGVALVFDDRVLKFNVRPGQGADGSGLTLGLWDGARELTNLRVAKLQVDRPLSLRFRLAGAGVYCDVQQADGGWENVHKIVLDQPVGDPKQVRIGKLDMRGGTGDNADLGELVRLRFLSLAAYGAVDERGLAELKAKAEALRKIRVSVHYEMYDGLPAMSKWITVQNGGSRTITVRRFVAEELAAVEQGNWVEGSPATLPRPDYLHVETDFAFGGFNHDVANRHVVHWLPDAKYETQVNYSMQTPCLLEVSPDVGPAQDIPPGETFASCRAFELVYDGADRERRGLALRRFYRTVAPWVTENPLTHHLLSSDPQKVKEAADQAAEVGFECIILSFGSGFDMENEDPQYLRQWREVADHAAKRGVEIGGYSLFSSRRIGGGNDIVSPPGKTPLHGSCPAATSPWGINYFQKLRSALETTGFHLFENDGPYPGDVDVTPRPPYQKGEHDSQWAQWEIVADFYRWCCSQGIYVNAPDYYYLNGTNKCGMGYRETNWSLPRAQQVIHARQNIYDGVWEKTPSMGWMFVPLAQYHGGGAAATIEPLKEHLDHYEQMLASNLGLGVQAHFRGPRLFDSPETKALVKQWVDWYKKHREILESDLVHGRRADGRDVDWMLHVNPQAAEKGMLVVYNPLPQAVKRTLDVNLYYSGLNGSAEISHEDGPSKHVDLERGSRLRLDVEIPPCKTTWYVIK